MKLVIEIPASGGGVSETMLCEFDLDGRNSLKNVLNRQEITWSVCEKNLDQKFDLTQKLEQFSERKKVDPLYRVLTKSELSDTPPEAYISITSFIY